MSYDKSKSTMAKAIADMEQQGSDYRLARAANPSEFGSADGSWDNTNAISGPFPLLVIYRDNSLPTHYNHRIFWGIHKHPWPLQYWYCFTRASDSRGERTNELVQFDIRKLPKSYIGRYKLDYPSKCDRRPHSKILERACADKFDFAGHAVAQRMIRELEAEHRAAQQAAFKAANAELDAEIPF